MLHWIFAKGLIFSMYKHKRCFVRNDSRIRVENAGFAVQPINGQM